MNSIRSSTNSMHYVLTLLLAALMLSTGGVDALAQRSPRKGKARSAASPAQSARHMLWRLQTDSTIVYLMGSVHMLPKGYYPLDTILERALDSSDVLVTEVKLDMGAQLAAAQTMMAAAQLEEGKTLSTVLDTKTYALAKGRMKKLGLDIALFESFEPWMVALTIAGLDMKSSGFAGDLGVDAHFSTRAMSEAKQLEGLESVEDQLALFDSMPLETQATFLRQTLEGRSQTQATLQKLAAAWRVGDTKALEKLALAEMKSDTAFYQRMLVNRNNAWLPKVESYLNTAGRRYLVVVGAAHLLGADGLIALLQAKGYEPVQM